MSPLPRVAYLGPTSSYSHQAALECFDETKYELVPQTIIAEIFLAVQTRSCAYGVVPFENSTNGSVVFTLDLLCDRDRQYPDAYVVGEAYLDVHHCLLSACDSLDQIKSIHSHPQAFGQCDRWLNSHLRGKERVDVSSTSKAAQIARERPPGDGVAAIASRVAADVHKLKTLAANIEDREDNTTRFFILSATERHPAPSGAEAASTEGAAAGIRNKTLLSFTVDHEKPGALCDSLQVFKEHGLNLTSIASRPSRVVPWNYIFFVEFEGHAEEARVKTALRRLDVFCREKRVLGTYQDRQKRGTART